MPAPFRMLATLYRRFPTREALIMLVSGGNWGGD